MFSIREEIIENTLNQIERIVQEKEALRLAVDCTIEALKKVIGLYFYFHMDSVDVKQPTWCPDEPIPPSPPDTWSANRVPIKPKPTPEKPRRGEEEVIRVLEPCQCDLGVECLCMKSSKERIEEAMTELLKEKPRKAQRSLGSSTCSTSKSSFKQSPLQNTEAFYEVIIV